MSWYDSARNLFSGGSNPLWEQAKNYAPSLAQVEPYWPKDLEQNLLPATSALLALDSLKSASTQYQRGDNWKALKLLGTAVALGTFSVWSRPAKEVALVAFTMHVFGKVGSKAYNAISLCAKRTFEKKYQFTCFECNQQTNKNPRQRLIQCLTCNHSEYAAPNEHGQYNIGRKDSY